MLFNSYEFILLFLPIAVIGHFALARASTAAAIAWPTAASLVFYAAWNPPYVALLGSSILGN
jgi:alginate O-acetyltransferase complex protein AlgI